MLKSPAALVFVPSARSTASGALRILNRHNAAPLLPAHFYFLAGRGALAMRSWNGKLFDTS